MNKRSLVENKSIQKEFLQRLSLTLRNFKWKSNGANFSCPICGDSKKSETKARGYIFEKENLYNYFCHNCGFSSNFSFFLKTINSILHTEYIKELFLDKRRTDNLMNSVKPKAIPSDKKIISYIKAPSIDSLNENHIAKLYAKRRKIPEKYLKELFYVNSFGSWVRKNYDPNYSGNDDERIIIPFYSGKKQLVAFQGRALSGNTRLRYITIKLNDNAPKIYNFHNVNINKKIYIVEGPIDAMFLPNAIAVAGSDVSKVLDKLNYDFVFVADREPRNPEIGKKIANMIERKYKVALLPESMRGKDINEYILNGFTINQIVQMIDRFTFEGLQATFQLKMWQKI
jgi:hypothetical protein